MRFTHVSVLRFLSAALVAATMAACVAGSPSDASDEALENGVDAPAIQPEAITCTPGTTRDCCPVAAVCGEPGEQTCTSLGSWSQCAGATLVVSLDDWEARVPR